MEFIASLTDDGEEITMLLREGIDPAIWEPRLLQGHVEAGKTVGFKIGVTYIQTPSGQIVIGLME